MSHDPVTITAKPTSLGIIQARMNSSRLPGKVLKLIKGKPMIYWIYQRARQSGLLDQLVVATSIEASDDPLAEQLETLQIPCFRGSLENVLGRYASVNMEYGPADCIVRLTGDNPLIDKLLIDELIEFFRKNRLDYATTDQFPYGYGAEIFTSHALSTADNETADEYDREHVTPFILRQPERFRIGRLQSPEDLSEYRWTVDYREDFEFISKIYELTDKSPYDFDRNDVLRLLRQRPELAKINSRIAY